MVKKLLFIVALLGVPLGSIAQKGATLDRAHTPRKGSAEEQSILKALRHHESVYFRQAASFKIDYLRVHHGWAWADVTPLDSHHKPNAEGGPSLLRLQAGRWKTLDLSKVPDDPDDPMGPEDASVGFIKNLRKKYPSVPRDIFPKPRH